MQDGGSILSLRKKMDAGEVAVSMIVRLVSSVEIAVLAAAAGFDALYVDLEHCGFSVETTNQICIAAALAGVVPLVRVASLDDIPRLLDGGAHGVIVPQVRSAAAAREAVAAAKYPPLGTRSASGPLPHLRFRAVPAAEMNPQMNAATTLSIMIETLEALEHVEDIAATPGVDLLLVGTNDLTAEMGIPGKYDDPRVTDTFRRVIDACRRNGIHAGIGGLASRPDKMAEFAAMGARFISSGNDLSFLLGAATARVKQVKGG
jgi:4-hydroxy-2-oxoheptanedioate aldolase